MSGIDKHFYGQRGEVYLRETVPGFLVLSWYPNLQIDPTWPGSIMDTSMLHDFPHDEAMNEDWDAVEVWINRQAWAQPLPPAS